MIEHKALHEWASWRDEWTAADVEGALAYAGLKNWTFDHWSDGDMQFMRRGPVDFDDLARLRIAFTPKIMIVEAVVDGDAEDEQNLAWEKSGGNPLHREPTPLMVLVAMSWYVAVREVSARDSEAPEERVYGQLPSEHPIKLVGTSRGKRVYACACGVVGGFDELTVTNHETLR